MRHCSDDGDLKRPRRRPRWARVACATLGLALVLLAAPGYASECGDPGAVIQSAPINIGANTTVRILAGAAARKIYVCGFVATLAGTTPTVKFEEGTQVSTACDTGEADLSGALAPSSGQVLSYSGPSDVMTLPPATDLCAATTGTGSSFQGLISYVQK